MNSKVVRIVTFPRLFMLNCLVLCLTVAASFGLSSVVAAASEPVAVGLISFTGDPLDNAVELEWETGTEQNTAGFKILRSSGTPGAFLKPDAIDALNGEEIVPVPPEGDAFIWSKGSPATGALYTIRDHTAINGATYLYALVEIESNSNEVEIASVIVTAGIPTSTPTATPVVITGNPLAATPTSDPDLGTTLATRTRRPTTTPTLSSPTATPSPTLTATTANNLTNNSSRPTNTPSPTATLMGGVIQNDNSPPSAVTESTQVMAFGNRSVEATLTREPGRDESPLAIVQTEPEVTPSDAYPVPSMEPPTAESADTFEELDPIPTDANAYPVGESSEINTPVSVIGGDGDTFQITPEEIDDSRQLVIGRVFLWGAFGIAGIIFVASVLGSIILFTRKRE